jgi:hypothetical protein
MEKGKAAALLILFIITIGLIPTANLLIDVLIMFNDAIFAVLNESILSFMFKQKITFYIVGLILSSVTSYFGIKLGSECSIQLLLLVLLGF